MGHVPDSWWNETLALQIAQVKDVASDLRSLPSFRPTMFAGADLPNHILLATQRALQQSEAFIDLIGRANYRGDRSVRIPAHLTELKPDDVQTLMAMWMPTYQGEVRVNLYRQKAFKCGCVVGRCNARCRGQCRNCLVTYRQKYNCTGLCPCICAGHH